MLLPEPKPEPRKFRDNYTGKVNVEPEQIRKQIRANIRRGLPQLMACPENDYKVALLCGGPSLNDAIIPRGYKIATCNGTYQWALDRGYTPERGTSASSIRRLTPASTCSAARCIPRCSMRWKASRCSSGTASQAPSAPSWTATT